MKMLNSRVLSAVVVVALAGTLGSAHAQDKDAAPAASQPAAAPAANHAEAKGVLDRARAAYRNVKTYQDKIKFNFEQKTAEGQGEKHNEEIAFAFAGPRKFAVTSKEFGFYASEKNQIAYIQPFKQYVEGPAGDEIMDDARIGSMGILTYLHVPANLLMTPAKFDKEFPVFKQLDSVQPEVVGGKPGKRVSGKGVLPDLDEETLVPVTMWFADETSLLGEVTVDLRPVLGAGPEVEKALATLTFTDVELNSEVAPDKYTFKPGDADKKVEKFGMDGPDPQQELVGKPAPDFKGVDLEGKPLNLSDFKGKVVLLDFWATWCPPCMQAIPKIQEISAEYADKGLVVIGMNQDSPEVKDKVKETVEKKKLTFRQFMDADASVARQFGVTGIPCTALIDGQGVIQWIHTGGGPGVKKTITAKVDKLLKGESLAPKSEKKDETKK